MQMNIKGKIITAILVCTLGAAVVIGAFSTFKMGTIIERETKNTLQEKAKSYGYQIDQQLKRIRLQANYLTSSITNSVNAQKIKMFLINYKRNTITPLIKRTAQLDGIKGAYFYFNPELIGKAHDVWFANPAGGKEEYVKQPELAKEKYSPDNSRMDWYYQAIDEKTGVWTTPHSSRVDDTTVISYNQAIYKGDLLIGVLGINFDFALIQEMVEQLQVKQSGYGFLVNNKSQFLFPLQYNQQSLADSQLSAVAEEMRQNGTGVSEYSTADSQQTVGYTHLSNGWLLGISLAKNKMFARRNRLVLLLITIIIGVSGLAVVGSYYFGSKISEPIEEAVAECNQMAAGNFSNQLGSHLTERQDEIGDLAESLNHVIVYLQRMVTSIKETIENLSGHGQQLSESVEAGQNTIQATKEVIEEMSASIQQISTSTNKVVELAQRSDAKAETGSQNIVSTLEKMGDINQAVDETVCQIEELNTTSQEIEKIVAMIAKIAEQTNLLALNASIEAARAGSTRKEASSREGKAGEGFAVVAEEIRQLADETSQATEEIAELIDETQAKADQGVKAVQRVKEKVATGNKIARETKQVTEEIIEASQDTTQQVEQTAQETNKLAKNSDEIVADTDEIKKMSENIAYSAQELAEVTKDLKKLVSQFQI